MKEPLFRLKKEAHFPHSFDSQWRWNSENNALHFQIVHRTISFSIWLSISKSKIDYINLWKWSALHIIMNDVQSILVSGDEDEEQPETGTTQRTKRRHLTPKYGMFYSPSFYLLPIRLCFCVCAMYWLNNFKWLQVKLHESYSPCTVIWFQRKKKRH